MDNHKALVPVTPTRSPVTYTRRVDSEDAQIMHSLNLKLQFKVHNLENEVSRLKEEVKSYRGKGFIYESLTKDLASLRGQLDKTAVALIKKCEAYDSLKKELATLKQQHNISPKTSRDKPKFSSPNRQQDGTSKRKLAIYHDIMNMSDDIMDYSFTDKPKPNRPSMGSCGNLMKEIFAEEAMPSCLKAYAAPTAPLRNRVLMKLHTLKSASTESLESAGRKSLKAQEVEGKIKSTRTNASSTTVTPSSSQARRIKPNLDIPVKSARARPNLNSSGQVLKGSTVKAPPSCRPALGQTNGRVIQINTTLKKSNSSCSAKSKPAFKF